MVIKILKQILNGNLKIYCFCLITCLLSFTLANAKSSQVIISKLYEKIVQQQATQTYYFQKLNNDTIGQWYIKKGLFASAVHLNFTGNFIARIIRNNLSIYDNNFFVTAWVLESLLKSEHLGVIDISQSLLANALVAELTFQDKNNPDVSFVTFWPQKEVQGYWQSTPSNLTTILTEGNLFRNQIIKVCEKYASKDQCEKFVSEIPLFGLLNLTDQFHIPADLDDTALNLSLGAALYSEQKYAALYGLWAQHNTLKKIKSAIIKILHYNYEPMLNLQNNQIIDPRSYYLMHSYIENHKDITIFSTWLTNIKEENDQLNRGLSVPVVRMPFNLNNIDPSVISNFIFAIMKMNDVGLLRKVIGSDIILKHKLNKALINSSEYIAWVLNNDVTLKRPDILTLYYPNKYNLYFFASRIIALYGNNNGFDPKLKLVKNKILKALRGNATIALLKTAKHQSNYIYWDDFLGDNEKHILSGHIFADDRIYTTSIIVNALLNIWTEPKSGSVGYKWNDSTPANVKLTISHAVNWLEDNALGECYQPYNAFFSGSVKELSSMPFLYPANFYQYINGNHYDPVQGMPKDPNVVIAIHAIPEKKKYQKMIKSKHFGYQTPTKFKGFNIKNEYFPYWSSPSLTYSFAIEAIAKFGALIN